MKQLMGVTIIYLIVISVSYGYEDGSKKCQRHLNYIQLYKSAVLSGKYLPQPLIESVEEAYFIQACLVRSDKRNVIGFKAGLTSNAAQEKFSIKEPVFGVLTDESQHNSSDFLIKNNETVLIEAELAFRLDKDINTLEDINRETRELVDAVAPVIEMPLFHFKDESALTGNDIIAANVGVNKYLLGKFVSIDEVEVSSIHASLSESGTEVRRSSDKISINRWQSLKWLIKKSFLEGYRLRKGMIYLTGSMVIPVIMKKTNYIVEYSQIDDIELLVK